MSDLRIRDLVRDHFAPCVPDLSPENPAIVIRDGCCANKLTRCSSMFSKTNLDSHFDFEAPLHGHLSPEDLYHFGVFKGAFRVEHAEIEAMKQLAAAWFIKLFENRYCYLYGEFVHATEDGGKGDWTKKAVEKIEK